MLQSIGQRIGKYCGHAFGIDVRGLALFRIAIAILLLGDLSIRSQDLTAHYTDDGILPRVARIQLLETGDETGWKYCWSVHMLSGETAGQAVLFLLAGGFAVSLLVGYRTRLSTIASWALLTSLHSRNPMILQGGDVFLRCLLFWSMFLPLGACASLDSRRNPIRSAPRVLSVASAAILLQVAMVYFFSSLFKFHPRWTSEFSAVYYALQIDLFATSLGQSLREHDQLLRLLTMGTLALEFMGPILAFVTCFQGRLRLLTVLAFWSFHVGSALCMELGPFPYVASVAWLLFIPSPAWDFVERAWAKLRHATQEEDVALHVVVQPLAGPIDQPAHSTPWWRILGQCGLAFLLMYTVIWNIRELHPDGWARSILPLRCNAVGRVTGIAQRWDMFSPPMTEDGWFVMKGVTREGQTVNLWDAGQRLPFEKPDLVSATLPNERWRKFLMNIAMKSNSEYRRYLADWLRWRWNTQVADSASQRNVHTVEVIYELEETPAPGSPLPKPQPLTLWTWYYEPIAKDFVVSH